MIFSETSFIFYCIFLILVFTALPIKFRVHWLLLCSLIWYASWSIYWVIFLLSLTAVNYFILLYIRNKTSALQKWGSGILVFFNVLAFIIIKMEQFGPYTFKNPFGSSFYIFILISIVVDKQRFKSNETFEKWYEFFLLPAFFPMLIAGPIERGKHLLSELRRPKKIEWRNVVDGILIFTLGYLKRKFLLSPVLLWINALSFNLEETPALILLLGFLETFRLYLELSSFTDMGRGVARCLSINLSLNFRPFYYAKNPNDFWQRWNITLGTWIRDYVSFPLMLRWGRVINQNLIIILSFIGVGVWHGIEWHWLGFGLYNGALIVLFNFMNKKTPLKGIGHIFSIILFIGNGLLQRTEWPLIKSFPDNLSRYHWIMALDKTDFFFLTVLVLFFVFEFFQERLKNVDWYLKLPGKAKLYLALIICIVFFWCLDANLVSDDLKSLPIYFRI